MIWLRALGFLLANETIGEPNLWPKNGEGKNSQNFVALTDDGNALRYLRKGVGVTGGNSEESSGLANQFKEFLN
ncbi:MAG: hypothetical protein Ct9H90mP23_1600 [Methanobacteriota archaeon]|nr:MAG: hypothetical protein Ct9H90mP23_1600 [Euryarchaeota archaeon]